MKNKKPSERMCEAQEAAPKVFEMAGARVTAALFQEVGRILDEQQQQIDEILAWRDSVKDQLI